MGAFRLKWTAAFGLLAVLALVLGGCADKRPVRVGPNWDAVWSLNPDDGDFTVTGKVGERFRVGELLAMQVNSTASGKLWVLQVDQNDAVEVLYPNSQVRDNFIRANRTLQIPPLGANWSLEAYEPIGETLIAFVVTTGNADLNDVLAMTRRPVDQRADIGGNARWGMDRTVILVER